MAIRNPNFQQTTTRTGPDTSTAELIGGLGQAGMSLFTGAVRNRVRDDLNDLQGEQLSAMTGLTDPPPGVDPSALADGANRLKDAINQSLEDQGLPAFDRGHVSDGLAGILTNYDQELTRMQHMQAQGAMTDAEFQIRARAIRKRMVDRYPGLAPEIDQVWQNHTQYDEGFMRASMALQAQQQAVADAQSERDKLLQRAKTINARPDLLLSNRPEDRAMFLEIYTAMETNLANKNMTAHQLETLDNIAKMSRDSLGPTAEHARRVAHAGRVDQHNFDMQVERTRLQGAVALTNAVPSMVRSFIDEQIKSIEGALPNGQSLQSFLGTGEGTRWLEAQKNGFMAYMLQNMQGDEANAIIWSRMNDHERTNLRNSWEQQWDQKVARYVSMTPEAMINDLQLGRNLHTEQMIEAGLNRLYEENPTPSMFEVLSVIDPMTPYQAFNYVQGTPFADNIAKNLSNATAEGIANSIIRNHAGLELAERGNGGGEGGEDPPPPPPLLAPLTAEEIEPAIIVMTGAMTSLMQDAGVLPEREDRSGLPVRPVGVKGQPDTRTRWEALGEPGAAARHEAANRRQEALVAMTFSGILSNDGPNSFANLKPSQKNMVLDVIASDAYPELIRQFVREEPAAARGLLRFGKSEVVAQELRTRAASLSEGGTPHRELYQEMGPQLFDATWDEQTGSYRMTLKPDALEIAKAEAARRPALVQKFAGLDVRATARALANPAFMGPAVATRTQQRPTADEVITQDALRELEDRANYSQRNVGRTVRAVYNMQPALYPELFGAERDLRAVSMQEFYDRNVRPFDPVLRARAQTSTEE